jgi:mono/diheme cytochrome c family protein
MNRPLARMERKVLAFVAGSFLLAAPAFGQNDASLFKSRCAGCHGPDGAGNTSIGKSMHLHSFASPEVQNKSDKELAGIITAGKGAMPSYKDKLSEAQIKDLVGYIRKLAKK